MFKKIFPAGATLLAVIAWACFLALAPFAFVSADTSVTISNEKVSLIGPQTVSVTWTTNVPANARVVYGPIAQAIAEGAGVSPQYGYASSTAEIALMSNEHMVVVGPVMNGTTYFRPVSSVGTTTAIGKEVSINTASLSGGSCEYVTTYLKKGIENNSSEVRKLQAFLRGVEKDTTVSVNGIFDDATYEGVMRFQSKYKNDVLLPWGVDTPTGYVYITTKRKINEIFCSTKIPLTQEEQSIMNAPRTVENDETTDSTMEIGRGTTITPNGLLVTEDITTTATGTSVVGKTDDIAGDTSVISNGEEEDLVASAGGIREFFSKNQFLVLVLFILAFVGIYLFGNKSEPKGDEKRPPKAKETSIQEFEG